MIVKTYEQEYQEKYAGITKCPSCGESRAGKVNDNLKRFDMEKELKCKDRFHVWFCNNNYSDEKHCHGHSRGYGRCMDLG